MKPPVECTGARAATIGATAAAASEPSEAGAADELDAPAFAFPELLLLAPENLDAMSRTLLTPPPPPAPPPDAELMTAAAAAAPPPLVKLGMAAPLLPSRWPAAADKDEDDEEDVGTGPCSGGRTATPALSLL